ncbi:MAG: protein TolR [Pseudomonadota bacterium]
MSEINVTPFVDVMLVLLIIFMVAAPLLTAGVELNLPESAAGGLDQPDEEPLTVSIDAAGAVFVQNAALEGLQGGALTARFAAIRGVRETGAVYLRADRTLGYGRVMEVMGALSAAGFRSIALVTDQAPAGDGG